MKGIGIHVRSSNPVMSSLTSNQNNGQVQGNNPFGQAGSPFGQADNPFAEQGRSSERPLTVDDVVTKTGITLGVIIVMAVLNFCLLYTSPSPRDRQKSRMPSSA